MIKNQFETVRFNELKRYLKTISDKTLSTNLKELEADKLIVRTEYPQIPPKVEYSLSERGKSLMTVLDQLCIWGEENRLQNQHFLVASVYILLSISKSYSYAIGTLPNRDLPDLYKALMRLPPFLRENITLPRSSLYKMNPASIKAILLCPFLVRVSERKQ